MSALFTPMAWEAKVPPNVKLVFLALCDQCADDGFVRTTAEALAPRCQISQNGVRGALAALQEQGYIEAVSNGISVSLARARTRAREEEIDLSKRDLPKGSFTRGLADATRAKLIATYTDLGHTAEWVEAEIELALSHESAKKWSPKDGYVRKWLSRSHSGWPGAGGSNGSVQGPKPHARNPAGQRPSPLAGILARGGGKHPRGDLPPVQPAQ